MRTYSSLGLLASFPGIESTVVEEAVGSALCNDKSLNKMFLPKTTFSYIGKTVLTCVALLKAISNIFRRV